MASIRLDRSFQTDERAEPVRSEGRRRRVGALDLPAAVAEHWHAVALAGDPRHRDVVAADHEVDVDLAAVDAVAILVADRGCVGVAERDVAGGVLVEERVREDGVELADPALAVDERDLAEPSSALVDSGPAAQRIRVLVGVDRDGAPALEAHDEPANESAFDVEGL